MVYDFLRVFLGPYCDPTKLFAKAIRKEIPLKLYLRQRAIERARRLAHQANLQFSESAIDDEVVARMACQVIHEAILEKCARLNWHLLNLEAEERVLAYELIAEYFSNKARRLREELEDRS